MASKSMVYPSRRAVTPAPQSPLSGPEQQNAGVKPNRSGPSITTNKDSDNNSKNNIFSGSLHPGGATWTTTTRAAATTSTYVPCPQYIHVAHRPNFITEHDRDNSTHDNHTTPTSAKAAPATARQTNELKQSARDELTVEFFQTKMRKMKGPRPCRVVLTENLSLSMRRLQLSFAMVAASVQRSSQSLVATSNHTGVLRELPDSTLRVNHELAGCCTLVSFVKPSLAFLPSSLCRASGARQTHRPPVVMGSSQCCEVSAHVRDEMHPRLFQAVRGYRKNNARGQVSPCVP